MKEQILYLDPLDDFHSMRDKIGWVQTERVLLVLPNRRGGQRLFTRQLDVFLIQRHAAKLGAKLALVTDDPVTCDFADLLGIQVFDAVDDSHLQPWRSRRPAPPKRQPQPKSELDDSDSLFTLPRIKILESPRLRLAAGAFIFFSIIAVITVMLALTLPGAQIIITPQTQTLTASVAIVADPAQTEIDPTNGAIPARSVTAIISGAIEVATTGSVDKATQKSGGEVTFTNLTNLEVRIPAGAAVRTTGGTPVRFITQTEVSLAAKKGSTGVAFVLAEEPGPLGNVSAGLINGIEGPLAVQAAVTNESAT
ncbi:MAG TPA: baseplate J/gp47 family protein, partial [Anaerolineales bacterium]|nr:baseplate J/gp47 family protein [Anaerolineales bacterium]